VLNNKVALWAGNSTPHPDAASRVVSSCVEYDAGECTTHSGPYAVVRLEIDAIQNAANRSLLGGGGSTIRYEIDDIGGIGAPREMESLNVDVFSCLLIGSRG